MDEVPTTHAAPVVTADGGTVRELRESVLLLVLAAASVGAYIAVGVAAVRLFAR